MNDIKIIRKASHKCSYFSIDGFMIVLKANSIKKVEEYIIQMEDILLNKKGMDILFTNDTGLNYELDEFRIIEYFVETNYDLVFNYFKDIKYILRYEKKGPELGRIGKRNCIVYISGGKISGARATKLLESLDKFDELLSSLFTIWKKRKKSNKRAVVSRELNNIGTITFLGSESNLSNKNLWDINGIEIEIGYRHNSYRSKYGKKSNFNLDEMFNKIKKTFLHIETILNLNILETPLIDIEDEEQFDILEYFAISNEKKLLDYFKLIAKKLSEKGIVISKSKGRSEFMEEAFNISQRESYACKRYYKGDFKVIKLIGEALAIEARNQFIQMSSKVIYNDDVWEYYYVIKGVLWKKIFKFDDIKNSIIKIQFKTFIKHCIERDRILRTINNNKSLIKSLSSYNAVKSIISYLTDKHNINSLSELSQDIAEDTMFSLEYNGLDKRITCRYDKNVKARPASIQSSITEFNKFIEYISKNPISSKLSKPVNYFKRYRFNGNVVKALRKKTDIIPEFVEQQMIKNLDVFLPMDSRRMLLIFLNTPRRFDEIQLLEEDCLSAIIDPHTEKAVVDIDSNPLYSLKFIEHKKEYINKVIRELTEESFVVVNHIVAREIELQKNETKKLRKKAGSKNIFIRSSKHTESGSRITGLGSYVNDVNNFIKFCNICNTDGVRWHFHAKQTRKTGAYKLGINNAPVSVLKEQLLHKNFRTTKEFYLELNQIILADMNTQYYKDEFDKKFTEKDKTTFSDQELKSLFAKFCIDARAIYYNQKMLGVCSLSPDKICPKGNCNDMNDIIPCATCSSLTTGKPCLSAWKSLLGVLESNIDIYNNFLESIPNAEKYKTKFREYNKNIAEYEKIKLVIKEITN